MSDRENKLPPCDLHAERCLLGSMLRLNAVLADVVPICRPDDCYGDVNQRVYTAILSLWERGQPADVVTIADRLKLSGEIGPADSGKPVDYGYLGKLWDEAPTAAHAEHYARIVRDKAITRKILHTAMEILRDAQDGAMPAAELLEKCEREFFAVSQHGTQGQAVPMSVSVPEACGRIDDRVRGKGPTGLATGILDLDRIICGLMPGEITVIAGRPSAGKTTLGMHLAYEVACRNAVPTFFVSLEQSRLDLTERLLSRHADIDSHKLRKGTMSAEEIGRLSDRSGGLQQAPLHIDDASGQTVTRIAANARRLKMKHKIGLMVIDYLQLVQPENRKVNRQEQITEISNRLQWLAKELQIPIVTLAQFNRGPEEGGGRRPRLSDIRESDAIIQDAYMVFMLWVPDAGTTDDAIQMPEPIVEIVVGKNKNGRTGTCQVLFRKATAKFENLAPTEFAGHFAD